MGLNKTYSKTDGVYWADSFSVWLKMSSFCPFLVQNQMKDLKQLTKNQYNVYSVYTAKDKKYNEYFSDIS